MKTFKQISFWTIFLLIGLILGALLFLHFVADMIELNMQVGASPLSVTADLKTDANYDTQGSDFNPQITQHGLYLQPVSLESH